MPKGRRDEEIREVDDDFADFDTRHSTTNGLALVDFLKKKRARRGQGTSRKRLFIGSSASDDDEPLHNYDNVVITREAPVMSTPYPNSRSNNVLADMEALSPITYQSAVGRKSTPYRPQPKQLVVKPLKVPSRSSGYLIDKTNVDEQHPGRRSQSEMPTTSQQQPQRRTSPRKSTYDIEPSPPTPIEQQKNRSIDSILNEWTDEGEDEIVERPVSAVERRQANQVEKSLSQSGFGSLDTENENEVNNASRNHSFEDVEQEMEKRHSDLLAAAIEEPHPKTPDRAQPPPVVSPSSMESVYYETQTDQPQPSKGNERRRNSVAIGNLSPIVVVQRLPVALLNVDNLPSTSLGLGKSRFQSNVGASSNQTNQKSPLLQIPMTVIHEPNPELVRSQRRELSLRTWRKPKITPSKIVRLQADRLPKLPTPQAEITKIARQLKAIRVTGMRDIVHETGASTSAGSALSANAVNWLNVLRTYDQWNDQIMKIKVVDGKFYSFKTFKKLQFFRGKTFEISSYVDYNMNEKYGFYRIKPKSVKGFQRSRCCDIRMFMLNGQLELTKRNNRIEMFEEGMTAYIKLGEKYKLQNAGRSIATAFYININPHETDD